MSDLFERFFSAWEWERSIWGTGGWAPAIENKVENGNLIVKADLPGIDPKEVSISVMGNQLTIEGERKREEKKEEKDYFYQEVSYGKFSDINNHSFQYRSKLLMCALLSCVGCVPNPVLHGDKANASQPAPSHWEKQIGDVYENKGIAKIEKVGMRYILTTYCNGIHSVTIKDQGRPLPLDDYLGQSIRARYTYIEEVNPDIQCVQPPCSPITERKIVLLEIEKVPVSEEELIRYQDTCSPSPPPGMLHRPPQREQERTSQ